MKRALPLAGIPAAVAAWSGWVLAVAVMGLVVIAAGLCWVVADAGRAGRLALLITAARGVPRGAQVELLLPSGPPEIGWTRSTSRHASCRKMIPQESAGERRA